MPLLPSQITFFASAQPFSSGGVITIQPVPESGKNNLFQDTPWQSLEAGQVVYKKIFLKNSSTTVLSALLVWLLQPTEQEVVSIGLGTPTDTDGTVVTYSNPTRDEGFALPTMNPGDAVAIWLRKTTPPNTPAFVNNNLFQIALTGTST
jgi:hypothetical protein